VAAERVRVEEGRAPSRWFELSFGHVREEDDPESLQEGLTLSLPAGSRIAQSTLRGTIDRVDVVENGGVRYAVAVDYKSGKGASYLKDMQDFADFQLPIYWAVLPMLGVVPVGAYFLGISSGERYGVIRKDLADHFVSPDDKGVKRLEPDEFERFMRERNEVLLGHVARLAAGEIEIAPRDGNCGYCELRPVCRVGTFGVGGVTDDA
jgi:ATP-dependent helicase/DNAse subunit B